MKSSGGRLGPREAAMLPPLLSEYKGMTVLVQASHGTSVNASTAMGMVQETMRMSQQKCPDGKGLRNTGSSAGGRKQSRRLASKQSVLPRKNKIDPTAPLPVVTEDELNKGLLSCINRGLIPSSFDVTGAMGGEAGQQPLAAEPVDLRPHNEQFMRRELLTADYGIAPICNLKLDLQAVLRPPSPSDYAKQPHDGRDEVPAKPAAKEAPDAVDVPTAHLGDKEREDPRTYTDLLDMYSLHEFVIRKGMTLVDTPEFQSYNRSYSACWGAVMGLIRKLETLLTECGIPIAYIDGKMLASFATIDMGISEAELVECINNKEEVLPLLAAPGRKYQRPGAGFHAAATKIQSVVRMHLQRCRYKTLREAHFAALLIQRQWQIHLNHVFTRLQIKKDLHAKEVSWRRKMDNFIRSWGSIRSGKRTIIHIPSLSYTVEQCANMPFYNCFQSAQLMRLLDLVDENVEVIYISPFPLEPEALQYYVRLLQLAGVEDVASRLHLLVPENAKRLPNGFSLMKSTLCSQRLLKLLGSLTKGKNCYVVPGVVGQEELRFACQLQLPMLGPDPAISQHFSSKSGSKRIFELADVVTPIGAYDMYEEEELLVILSKFVAEYPEYQRWLIKLDHECNGRGIASLDVRRLKCLEEAAATQDGKGGQDVAALREKVYLELKEYIGKRVKIVTPHAYPDWESFVQAFNVHGGVIEAVPTDCLSSPVANLFIHPDGAVQLLSVQEQVLSPQYCGLGALFPQTAVPHAAVRDASLSIASVCYQKKVVGYFSVEYVVFRRDNQLRMWAVDLDLHLTNNSLIHRLFQFTTGSKPDPHTGLCLADDGTPLRYVYSGLVYHPYIAALRHSVFFNRCKLKGLAFDTVDRTGTLFHLVDSILKGCVGVLCISKTEDGAVRELSEAMEFIQQQLTNSSGDEADSNFASAAAAARALFQKVIAQRRVQGARRLGRKTT
ncbi:hypothetical protein DIPPA_25769 [Diplonema papillatum]|nr:hypothetical protein DIPPA_25769 [Diplonema papillatum]